MLHFNSIHPYSDNTVYTLWFLIDSSFRMSVVGASEGTNNQYISSTYPPLIICGFTSASCESTTVCLPSNILILVTDCVSGMWFCNTCTLGCVLGEAASFSSMQFWLLKKGGAASLLRAVLLRTALSQIFRQGLQHTHYWSSNSQVNWDMYTWTSVQLSSRKSHVEVWCSE